MNNHSEFVSLQQNKTNDSDISRPQRNNFRNFEPFGNVFFFTRFRVIVGILPNMKTFPELYTKFSDAL